MYLIVFNTSIVTNNRQLNNIENHFVDTLPTKENLIDWSLSMEKERERFAVEELGYNVANVITKVTGIFKLAD